MKVKSDKEILSHLISMDDVNVSKEELRELAPSIASIKRRIEEFKKGQKAEPAKLRECVEFYAKTHHWGIGFVGEMTCIDPFDCEDNRGGKRARQVLKELENK